eukprot:s1225_g4.t1
MAEPIVAQLRRRAAVAEVLREEIRSWQRNPGFATAVLKRLARLPSNVAVAENVKDVLEFMVSQTVEVNVIHCNAAIAVCARGDGLWPHALDFLRKMMNLQLSPDVFTCSSTMNACLKDMQWQTALGMFEDLRKSTRPDLTLSNTALSAADAWDVAAALLKEMPEMELRPDVISFSTTMHGAPWRKSLVLLQQMQVVQLEGDRQLFSSILADCWRFSMELLRMMSRNFLEADTINWGSTLSPLADARRWLQALYMLDGTSELNVWNALMSAMRGDWRLASELFQELEMAKLRPDELTFNTRASTFASAARWRDAVHLGHLEMASSLAPWLRAMQLVEAAKQQGLQPNMATVSRGDSSFWEVMLCSLQRPSLDQVLYSATLSEMEAASAWEVALSLLGSIRRENFDEISFGAAISVAAKGRQWQTALALMKEMRELRLRCSQVPFNSVSSACERGNKWSICVSLLDAALGASPDVVTYNVALSATQKVGSWQMPCLLLEEMSAGDLQPDVISHDTVLLSCCQQQQWSQALGTVGSTDDMSMESCEVLITACEGQHVHRVACSLLLDLRESCWNRKMEKRAEIQLAGWERWDAMHLQELDEATDVHKTSEVAVLLMEALAEGNRTCSVTLWWCISSATLLSHICLQLAASSHAMHVCRRLFGPRLVALQDIENLAAAELGKAAKERWTLYASRASQLVGELNFQEASRIASAFSTARYVEFPLFAKLSARALECLPKPIDNNGDKKEQASEVSAGDLRQMALACGRAQCFDSDLMEAMVPLIEERLQDFRPKELVQIADAYVQSPELFALVAEVLPRYLYDLRPPELATLCRSFAEVALYNEELSDALAAEVEKRARSFGAMECLIFLDGLSRLHEGMDEDR